MNKLYPLVVAMLVFVSMNAQDPVFNQTDNSRNYLNPAYIGTDKSFSADFNYRNQWPQLSGNYKTLAVQLNQYLGKGNGVSIHFVNDNAANTLKKLEIGIGFAKGVSLNAKSRLILGVQASYFKRELDYSKLTFGDMVDPRRGFVYDSQEASKGGNVLGFDFNAGALYYNKHFFAGYTLKHITQPNESFVGGDAKLPMRHGIQLGGKIKWNKVDFIPSILYYQQANFRTAFASLKVKVSWLEVDAGVHIENGIFGGVGFHSDHFNIGYNYTLSASILGFNASTHEIRMGCDFMLFKKVNESFFDF
jgi:type IX secretion system PorP/SprF family membrane protein